MPTGYKIAIIGTGISGLGAASLLHGQHDIVVYEQAPVIGGHTRTLDIRYGDRDIAVDTGFIVFNKKNYPYLTALFRHLNVPIQKSDMTFGVSINNGELEWGARNLNALFGQRRNLLEPKFLRLLWDVLRFNRLAYATAERHPELTLRGLLETLKMGSWFAQYYILPMGGAIWSCSLATMLEFPALGFVRFFKSHGLLTITQQPQWFTVSGGGREYAKRLSAPFADNIRVNDGVAEVKRIGNKVVLSDKSGEVQIYDHAIFACHADQALALLKDATPEETAVLGAFRYQKNTAVLHKDSAQMPVRKRCWSSWVYSADKDSDSERVCVTYWMNKLQGIDPAYPLFVTLNPIKPIAAEHIFNTHEFAHPVYDAGAVAAQARISALQGRQNTWFCGAYTRNGFHEDGLSSAVSVAKALGAEASWL